LSLWTWNPVIRKNAERSADLDPGKLIFIKLKALLRKAGEPSVEGRRARCRGPRVPDGKLIEAFQPPQECANYFAAAGMIRIKPKTL
jgi:hypothetical protein